MCVGVCVCVRFECVGFMCIACVFLCVCVWVCLCACVQVNMFLILLYYITDPYGSVVWHHGFKLLIKWKCHQMLVI